MKRAYVYMLIGLAIGSSFFWRSCADDGAPPESDTISQRSKSRPEIPTPSSRTENIRNFLKHADTQIDFFGRVIDQEGNGIGGVSVHYVIRKAGNYLDSGILENTDQKEQCLTGADGRFEIRGVNGHTLQIGPLEKAGYRDGSKSPRSFGFNGTPQIHSPDSQRPVEFLLVIGDVPRTKEVYDKRLEFPWNQGEVRIRLDRSLGDFVLTPVRQRQPGQLRDFDWNIKVRMENAELALLPDDAAGIAPPNGYQNSFEYGALKGDQKWQGGVQARYAFRTSQGTYGIIRFHLYPERDDYKVNGSLNVRLNDSGARNLD